MSCSCSPSSATSRRRSSGSHSSGSDSSGSDGPLVRASPKKVRVPPSNRQPDRHAFIDLNSDEEFPALPRASSLASSPEGDNANIITAPVQTAMR